MRTGAVSAAREGAAQLLALLVLLTGLVGCTSGEGPASPQQAAESADVITEVRGLLARRAEAVIAGDESGFLGDVATRRRGFVVEQRRYFHNVRQLPLKVFTYAVPDGGVVTEPNGRFKVRVSLSMQLDGFDARPVETPARYTFRRTAQGRIVLAAVRDRAFESANDTELSPWDLGPIEVETSTNVLGIFDPDSVDAAYQIMDSVEEGITYVNQRVPMPWSGRVVVYALSDVRVLGDLDNLPGGDPDRLDGVAFPVRAGPGSRKLAGTRFMLHPRMIYRNDGTRDRLIRHELTHVAIGRRDDHVPTWLAEGIAEFVSVQPIDTYERMISSDAVEAARNGLDALPADETFNGDDSGANYGVAWYACEYIVATYGEDALWRLFDAMRKGDGTEEADQDDVLRAVLGVDSAELARGAGQKILGTFG